LVALGVASLRWWASCSLGLAPSEGSPSWRFTMLRGLTMMESVVSFEYLLSEAYAPDVIISF
jgi:hypothetical protein